MLLDTSKNKDNDVGAKEECLCEARLKINPLPEQSDYQTQRINLYKPRVKPRIPEFAFMIID